MERTGCRKEKCDYSLTGYDREGGTLSFQTFDGSRRKMATPFQ